jgi:deoxyribonuclease-4
MKTKLPILGAHVSTASGLNNAIDKALEIGAVSLQIFQNNPRTWASRHFTSQQIKNFRNLIKKHHLGPIFIHSVYFINLATPKKDLLQKSINSLIRDLKFANQIKAQGVVFHLGSHLGQGFKTVLSQVVSSLETILQQTKLNQVFLILENSAGQKHKLGSNLEELTQILQEINKKYLSNIAICLDTMHLFGAGYDLRSERKIKKFVQFLKNQKITQNTSLFNLLKCWHYNDSKVNLNSGRDLHQNIGQGKLGLDTFKFLLHQPEFKNIPIILEVPGFNHQGPDKKNIDILKALR